MASSVVKLGMDYEASFQQVIRTTGLAGKEIEQVKNQLLDMSTKVPESFQNLRASPRSADSSASPK